MPKLYQIELFLDGTYPKEEQKAFIFKSRCICNYLERALGRLKFETTLSRINIKCTKEDVKPSALPLKGAPYLEVVIRYDIPPISSMDEVTLQKQYERIIGLGLRGASTYMPVPYKFCMESLKEFGDGGFNNDWIHLDKTWKRQDLRSVIEAEVSMEKFSLSQSVFRSDKLVAKKLVAETKPREMLFLSYLGKFRIKNDEYLLYEKKGKIISTFNLKNNSFE